MTIGQFLELVEKEIHRARGKFPSSDGVMVALMEEAGELAKAYADEPRENVIAEAVQVAAMAARVALEGDRHVDFTRVDRGREHLAQTEWRSFHGLLGDK